MVKPFIAVLVLYSSGVLVLWGVPYIGWAQMCMGLAMAGACTKHQSCYWSQTGHGTSSKPSGKGRKVPFPQDTCYRCGKGRHQKVQDCKAVDAMCRGCGKKGHFEKVCLKKHSTHSLEVPQASTSTAGAGATEPLYFNDERQPVYIYMVSVPHVNKHLIKFLIALDHATLRGNREGWNNMENSTKSTAHSPQSVLLKADTGANVNLMNRKTFDELFGEAKGVLQLTPIRMENYGNTAVKVLGMFHAFLRWKDRVYSYFTLQIVTDPLIYCQGMLVTLLEF